MNVFQKNKLLKLFGNDVKLHSSKTGNSSNSCNYSSSTKHAASTEITKSDDLTSSKVTTRPATNLSKALSGPPKKKLKQRNQEATNVLSGLPKKKLKKRKHETANGNPGKSQKLATTTEDENNTTKPEVRSVKSKKDQKTRGKKVKNLEAKERLEGARFRFINEMLYTSTSKDAVASFKKDPSSFEVYHQGYRRQIDKWPVKPIDLAIRYVKSRPKGDVIADLGCGDAKLAATVAHKVHSFDIRALNDRVIEADMAKLPLAADSVDVVVYCLSLMGTNIAEFLEEARRVLKEGGVIWIAEVASRFEGDLKTFCDSVESLGFKCTSCRADMSHFVTMTFKKTESTKGISKSKKRKVDLSLAPCLYKKR